MYNDEIRQLAKERFVIDENAPRIVTGKSITNNSISDEISVRIPNGPCAFAVDVAATIASRKGSLGMLNESPQVKVREAAFTPTNVITMNSHIEFGEKLLLDNTAD